MKSRTSFCNPTLIRKDIVRFAPIWVLYTIFSLLLTLSSMTTGTAASNLNEFNTLLAVVAIFNFLYGFITAQLLFGDLFKSRLCNALHAMPVNRTHQFWSHVVSGLLFSLVPNLLVSIAIAPTLREFWYAGFLWLAGASLSYIFFFSVCVFCVMLTGNRFAATAVYAIINFFSYVVYWFIHQIFLPVMPGILLEDDIFFLFCPIAVMVSGADFCNLNRLDPLSDGAMQLTLGSDWIKLLIFGAVGIAICFCALLLYRRRALEKAGEFLSVKQLEPLFLIIYTLCAGAFLSLFAFVDELHPFFLAIGLILGFFTGRMLIERTVRVFRKQTFLLLAATLLLVEGAVGLAKLDVLGIVNYVPDVEDIAYVSYISTNGLYYGIDLDAAQEIETVVQAHETILKHLDEESRIHTTSTIVYHLNSGKVVRRKYRIYSDDAYNAVQKIEWLPKVALGFTDPAQAAEDITSIYVYSANSAAFEAIRNTSQIAQLLEALYQDQREGNIRPNTRKEDWLYSVEYSLTSNTLCIDKSCAHTVAWLDNYFAAPENNCIDAISGDTIDLTTAAYTYIQVLLGDAAWIDDAPNCAYDYIFYTLGRDFFYHSECGTFYETEEYHGYTVSDVQRACINQYLGLQ